MTPEQIAAVAGKLSPLEREWITGWQGPPGAAFNAIAGDLRRFLKGPLDWTLNSDGEAVRDYLEKEARP